MNATARSTISGGRCSNTSTPSSLASPPRPRKQTIGFFNQNLVSEYTHEQAVADGVNVGYDVYRIKTKVTEQGGKVEKGLFVDHREQMTRKPAGSSWTTT